MRCNRSALIQETLSTRRSKPGWRSGPVSMCMTPHLCLLAEPGGALVRTDHSEGDPAGQLLQCQRTDREDQAVRRVLRQEKDPVSVDCNGGFNPGKIQRLCSQISGHDTIVPNHAA